MGQAEHISKRTRSMHLKEVVLVCPGRFPKQENRKKAESPSTEDVEEFVRGDHVLLFPILRSSPL